MTPAFRKSTKITFERADVCILVLSAEEMITAQDLHISGFIKELMRPCIILMNKFDLITNDQKEKIIYEINNTIQSKLSKGKEIKFWDGKTSERIYKELYEQI